MQKSTLKSPFKTVHNIDQKCAQYPDSKKKISRIWTQNQHIHLSKTTKPPQIKRAPPKSHPLLLLLFRENKVACYIKLGKGLKSCQSFQIQGSR